MTDLSQISNQIAAASAELRLAAWKDREVMLKRERELNRIKADALMDGVRAGAIQFNPVDDYLLFLHYHVALPCGCVTDELSYERRWAIECSQHKHD